MLESTSRYSQLEDATITLPSGRVVTYKRRRFLPAVEAGTALAEISVTEGDRLDLLVARVLGEPQLFWQVCDANGAMNPFDLLEEPGTVVRIAVPRL
ncbi:MAG TPA: hypothetical protein VIG99_16955 [Myxococcaceae bacterium]|jgi:hypothetical protein